LGKLSIEIESIQASAKSHGGPGAGLVAEIAADYTKDVIEKVQSRAASEVDVEEVPNVPPEAGGPLEAVPEPPESQAVDEPDAAFGAAVDVQAVISQELVRLEAELKIQLTQQLEETCRAVVAEALAPNENEVSTNQEPTNASEAAVVETMEAEAKEADAEMTVGLTRTSEKSPLQELKEQVSALEAAVAELRRPATAEDPDSGDTVAQPETAAAAVAPAAPQLEVRVGSMEAKVRDLAAAVETLSDGLAILEGPPAPGEAPTIPRPASRSAEIFGRLDSLEARVSALEQRKGSKAEGEGVAPTADPTEAGTGMGSASATEAESEARGLAMEPEAEESERERFAPEVPELTGEEQATGCLEWNGEPGDWDEKLTFLGDHVHAAAPEQAELLSGIVKDVKYCLKRCELLFQLPEVKGFIKRFQESLHVNAVLQDRWLGPGGRSRGFFDDENLFEGSSRIRPSSSAVDLSLSNLSTDPITRVRRNEAPNKRPFRTVTDWARPHTPLTVDPVLKTSTPSLPDILPPK